VDGAECAKSLNRPGLQRLLALISSGKVQGVIVARLDRLTRSVKDLCQLLELFERKNVALVSMAESLDTGPRRRGRSSSRSWAPSASGSVRRSENGLAT
jgi:DNA invertase Pin-like site-specific DNA recombinase